MSTRIRLQRFGTKKKPSYRIAVMDSRKKRNGEPTETIGNFNPFTDVTKVNKDRFSYWLKCGAIPSARVNSIMRKLLRRNDEGIGSTDC